MDIEKKTAPVTDAKTKEGIDPEEVKDKVKEAISDFIGNIFAFVIFILVLYFTLIHSGFLSDTLTGWKNDDPSSYFTGDTQVQIVISYTGVLFQKADNITVTLNGIELGTVAEGKNKIFLINLEKGKTYRLRIKGEGLTQKVKLTPNDNMVYFVYEYDDGKIKDVTPITVF